MVETRDAVYTYVMDEPPKQLTVTDTDTWVIDPVPGKPDAKPTQALITLTTCQDLFHSPTARSASATWKSPRTSSRLATGSLRPRSGAPPSPL